MSRVNSITLIAVSVAAALIVGCGTSLLSVRRLADHTAEQGQVWESGRRELVVHESRVVDIVYGRSPADPLQGRLIATLHHVADPAENMDNMCPSLTRVVLWNPDGSQSFSLELALRLCQAAIGFSADGKQFLFTTRETLKAWNIEQRTLEDRFPLPLAADSSVISDDGRLIAVHNYNDPLHVMHVLEIETGNEIAAIETKDWRLTPVAFLDSNRLLATTGNKGGVSDRAVFWELETGRPVVDCAVDSWRGAFVSDGSRYAARTSDRRVSVWDTASGSLLITTGRHPDEIRAIAFSPDVRMLATAGDGAQHPPRSNGVIKVWETATGRELATIGDDSSGSITSLAFSPDGTELASGNQDGHIRFWKVPAPAALELLAAR